MGIPVDIVSDMLDRLERNVPLRSLDVEWQTMPLATVRKLDLPDEWGKRYKDAVFTGRMNGNFELPYNPSERLPVRTLRYKVKRLREAGLLEG